MSKNIDSFSDRYSEIFRIFHANTYENPNVYPGVNQSKFWIGRAGKKFRGGYRREAKSQESNDRKTGEIPVFTRTDSREEKTPEGG